MSESLNHSLNCFIQDWKFNCL